MKRFLIAKSSQIIEEIFPNLFFETNISYSKTNKDIKRKRNHRAIPLMNVNIVKW